jgi:hypothetical protein
VVAEPGVVIRVVSRSGWFAIRVVRDPGGVVIRPLTAVGRVHRVRDEAPV